MSEEEMPSTRFSGRTYSRSKQNPASRAFDEATEGKAVSVKAAMSIQKWGKANYVPFRDSADGASEVKRMKMETKGEDPFSFDSEDPRKQSPVKRQVVVAQPDMRPLGTRLPASRIITKGKGAEEYLKDIKGESKEPTTALRTYTRTSPKKPVILNQFVEVGKTTVTSSKDRGFTPVSAESPKKEVKAEEEDDIFPAQFKREPLRTYAGEVVTPVDKPDSPPPRKGYKKKGGPRGRKPLTVSDPELIEEYKRNYAAQQKLGKTDTATGGLNNSTVVSKKEMANEDQGTTVVVVCKPKAQVGKGEVQQKYFTKAPKKTGYVILDVASESPSSQDTGGTSENGSSTGTTPISVEGAATRSSARLRSEMPATPATKVDPATSSSGSSAMSAPATSPIKRYTRARNSNTDSTHLSQTQTTPASGDSSSQAESASGRGGKRYRIFKSRTPQIEEELKPPVFKGDEEDEESPFPPNDQETTSQKAHSTETDTEGEEHQHIECTESLQESEDPNPSSLEPENSSELMDTTEAPNAEDDSANSKGINATAARESLAARLRNMDKGNESDSTEHDNLSECSENFLSQESPANSQSTVEESSQKEDSGSSGAPRRFFKSKKSSSNSSDLQRKIFGSSPQKSPAKATYNARNWNNEGGGEKEDDETDRGRSRQSKEIMLVKNSSKGPRLSREVHWPERSYDEAYTSLRVSKTHKELYTVVHNVKQTHEVQELGETQDFMDDVDYLLDSLRDTNSKSIRCLSCLKLAGKCIMPAFRMHLRAHGTVTKVFSLLHDACSDPSLALSTSAMMFMLSRDRLNMDLDQESLNLMLKLNEVDASDKSGGTTEASLKELEKTKQRVQELLSELQQETNAREIDLGFVSTGNLAMESLLSLTSRRAGEWFKEELRSAGGLDHIVDSVTACEKALPENLGDHIDKALPVLRKLDRCLRVLENISFQNSDNQNYLISYKNAVLLASCGRTLRLCQACMPVFKILENPEENQAVKQLPGYTLLTCLLAVLKVLLNVTHEHSLGKLKPEKEKNLMETILKCLTSTQWCIPTEQRFDLAVLCLGMLINMVENCSGNRGILMQMKTVVRNTEKSQPRTMTAPQALVELFCEREEAARELEENAEGTPDTSAAESPNKSGEWQESDSGIQWITNNLKKAKEEQAKANQSTSSQEAKQEEEGSQSILEDDEETFTKALHKAGKHMENSIVASYAGVLLGTTISDNQEHALIVKKLIPNGDFTPMIKILKKFLNFMSLTTAFSSTDVNGITRVIQVLESV